MIKIMLEKSCLEILQRFGKQNKCICPLKFLGILFDFLQFLLILYEFQTKYLSLQEVEEISFMDWSEIFGTTCACPSVYNCTSYLLNDNLSPPDQRNTNVKEQAAEKDLQREDNYLLTNQDFKGNENVLKYVQFGGFFANMIVI